MPTPTGARRWARSPLVQGMLASLVFIMLGLIVLVSGATMIGLGGFVAVAD